MLQCSCLLQQNPKEMKSHLFGSFKALRKKYQITEQRKEAIKNVYNELIHSERRVLISHIHKKQKRNPPNMRNNMKQREELIPKPKQKLISKKSEAVYAVPVYEQKIGKSKTDRKKRENDWNNRHH